jgi:uncharacterized membrane protein YedE/YeeE
MTHITPAAGSTAPALQAPSPLNGATIAILLILVAIALVVGGTVSIPQAMLYLTGVALGVSLYHASFGFTGDFRVLTADGRSANVRAQMVMLALAILLFYPAMAAGTLFGRPVGGFVAPAGTSVAVGAFIFGIGM